MAENKALLEIMRQKMMKDGMKGLTGGDSATVAPDNRLLPGREGLYVSLIERCMAKALITCQEDRYQQC